MNKNQTAFFASIGLLLAACIWGFAFVVVKDSLSYIGTFYIMAFRFTIATISLSLIFFNRLFKINISYIKHGFLLGLLIFLAYAFQTVGCNYTTAGKNAFLTTVYVVAVPFFVWFFQKRRPHIYVFFAAFIAFLGIALLALTGDDKNIFLMNKGDVLTLICGIFYALHILYIEKYTEAESPILLTILQFAVVAIFSWIFALFFEEDFSFATLKNTRIIFSMLYLGIFSTMIAYAFQNVGQKYVPSSLASLLLSFEAVFGVIFSTIFLNESLTARMILGCLLIFVAVLLSQVKNRE